MANPKGRNRNRPKQEPPSTLVGKLGAWLVLTAMPGGLGLAWYLLDSMGLAGPVVNLGFLYILGLWLIFAAVANGPTRAARARLRWVKHSTNAAALIAIVAVMWGGPVLVGWSEVRKAVGPDAVRINPMVRSDGSLDRVEFRIGTDYTLYSVSLTCEMVLSQQVHGFDPLAVESASSLTHYLGSISDGSVVPCPPAFTWKGADTASLVIRMEVSVANRADRFAIASAFKLVRETPDKVRWDLVSRRQHKKI